MHMCDVKDALHLNFDVTKHYYSSPLAGCTNFDQNDIEYYGQNVQSFINVGKTEKNIFTL